MEFDMKRSFGCYLILFFCLMCCVGAEGKVLYVSVAGDDGDTGTRPVRRVGRRDGPVRSVGRAMALVRDMKRRGELTEDVHVVIGGGRYELGKTWAFLHGDSGKKDARVIYEAAAGEQPVFSGGVVIEGFVDSGKGYWVADVRGVKDEGWRFEQLFVNGRRAVLARSPNVGFYKMGETEEIEMKAGKYKGKHIRLTGVDDGMAEGLKFLKRGGDGMTRMVAFHKWCISKRVLLGLDKTGKNVVSVGDKMISYKKWMKGTRYFVENYLGGLDAPGEWYLSAEGKLYYKPREGELIGDVSVVAPRLDRLVHFSGDAKGGRSVGHVTLKGLRFEHQREMLKGMAFKPSQAAYVIEAAVMLDDAHDVVIKNCEVKRVGGYGVWFRKGCKDILLEGCEVSDLGAGGVRIGEGVIRGDLRERTERVRIDNNIIRDGGKMFASAVGVWVGQSGENEITHNVISDFYYTGISLGWRWGYGENLAKGNVVKFNHVHDIGKRVLSDMGGIYMLGPSEGTVVSNNVFHDIYAYTYGGWGLYTDEGATGILMENNLVYNTKTGSFHQHYGKDNVVRNNILAMSELHQIQATRVEDHLSFTFEGNIVYWEKGPLYKGPFSRMNVKVGRNLYWRVGRDKLAVVGVGLKNLRKRGMDKGSVVADPKFVDAEGFDFRLKGDSPAVKRIGFKIFDLDAAGVYGSEAWKERAGGLK